MLSSIFHMFLPTFPGKMTWLFTIIANDVSRSGVLASACSINLMVFFLNPTVFDMMPLFMAVMASIFISQVTYIHGFMALRA